MSIASEIREILAHNKAIDVKFFKNMLEVIPEVTSLSKINKVKFRPFLNHFQFLGHRETA